MTDDPFAEARASIRAGEAAAAAKQVRVEQQAAADRSRVNDLIRNFLSRMNAVGSPGANETWKEGRFGKGVRFWRLDYDHFEGKSSAILLTIDGRILVRDNDQRGYVTKLVPFEEGSFEVWDRRADEQYKSLRSSMAWVMEKYRVP